MGPKDVRVGEKVQINYPLKSLPSDMWGGIRKIQKILPHGVEILSDNNLIGIILWKYIEKLRIDNWKQVIEND